MHIFRRRVFRCKYLIASKQYRSVTKNWAQKGISYVFISSHLTLPSFYRTSHLKEPLAFFAIHNDKCELIIMGRSMFVIV
jgi:hypothetical protein